MNLISKTSCAIASALVILQGAALSQPAAMPENAEAAASAPAAAGANKHLKLCQMLGLKVNSRYEFMIAGNEYHYWEVRSLGANGWIQVRDSRHASSWVNLSQVIAVTPFNFNLAETRPEKRGARN